ncbi:2,3-dihydro-2,3-dihydroxybenzoate dehydrogenase [Chromobacterium sphagni]|uniref:2,3-dihydro-2,3-dihydroxybenzoate dehydrogenase n=1 Tax=Chromobacterium sphagni TaxID=1903179 RepID=A0A1S1X4F7_9NEIS|nr:2,3-dihydro-2,3-dihydroxybenzoate dehydrogenase [Chromobacterium sphagni]OHX14338.1 2,3-dihydro-2,3-dihydroxybenzoate dehydrogenase [Chromobacterium sphagni]OHX16332.1 2,3-dihydro-2,3-dihydroxybenzoate dehydrogenase [Chromobacterium sphagni]
MRSLDFNGQCVWVTGAAQGIGHEVARRFVEAGARVIALDWQFPAEAEQGALRSLPLDIRDAAAVAALCARLAGEQSLPDVLVNAAGVLRLGALDALSPDDWQQCLAVNVSGPFYLLRELLPHFKAQRRGAIVNVASNAAHVPRMEMAAYGASKAAMASLSHNAALELAPYGVRCNVVSPGSTDTPMLRGMWQDENGAARTIAGKPEAYRLGIPLGKLATVADIAGVVLFLASDLAGHVTMQDVVVDGGATLAA